MRCEGTPLDETQVVGWCCGCKEISEEDVHKVLGDRVKVPFCKVWREGMRRRDAEFREKYQYEKRKGLKE